ncbi:MAG: tail assembly protein [Candidatus Nanopelagicaceae bacterium]
MTGTKRRWVEVKLLGELGRKFGRHYRFMALNAREVIVALSRQIEGFQEYLANAHENGIGFKLVTKDPEGLDYDGVFLSCDRLVMAPIVTGAGGNVGQILIGAALIALAFIPGVGTVAATGAFSSVGTALFGLGASLFLTGIAGLLSPPVQTPTSDTKKKESFIFDRATELTTQGFPVPLIYGRYRVQSSLVISSSIATEQIPI